MKHFETPTVEIERFDLLDTIAVSLVILPDDPIPTFTMPDDEFSVPGFYESY
ncbi:MAG: hypothetical protein IJJ99_10540 [Oscillospiraceae bacterium]|nr:hypothetical protein [Oscillospiraceae bacterium]